MRVAEGALKAAKRPGRGTTVPIAEMVCVNGSMLAATVFAATTGVTVAVAAVASSLSPPWHPPPSAATVMTKQALARRILMMQVPSE